MKLRKLGFYCELKHGDPNGPSLKNAVRSSVTYHKDDVVNYLRYAPVLIASPGVVCDVLDSTCPIICAPNIHTDGLWVWPEDLAYYVNKYNVELPDEFLDYIQSGARRPPTEDELNMTELEL